MELRTLTVEEILRIHFSLVEDFSRSGDPISPPGVRSQALLESAVGRQDTGSYDARKYPDPIGSAATLLFGVCCDHPFHNGNKRSAIVAMLVHLDKNKMALRKTSQRELYAMILDVATHTLGQHSERRKSRRARRAERHADDEVGAIIDWLRLRAGKVVRGEKTVTFFDLRVILESFDFTLKNPKGNTIDVVKLVERQTGVFRRTRVLEEKRIGNIGYPREGADVPVRTIKYVREICRLREEDGIDSETFYGDQVVVDAFINRYRTLLRRLAKV